MPNRLCRSNLKNIIDRIFIYLVVFSWAYFMMFIFFFTQLLQAMGSSIYCLTMEKQSALHLAAKRLCIFLDFYIFIYYNILAFRQFFFFWVIKFRLAFMQNNSCGRHTWQYVVGLALRLSFFFDTALNAHCFETEPSHIHMMDI